MNSLQRFIPNPTPCGHSRREFLWEAGAGFAGLALVDLLSRDGYFDRQASAAETAEPESDGNSTYLLAPKKQHFPAKAKHCVFLFMNGAPSQVDTFDPKPKLNEVDGQTYHPKDGFVVGSNGRPVTARSGCRFRTSSRSRRSTPMTCASFVRCGRTRPRTLPAACR